MVQQIMPEQVVTFWGVAKEAIEQCLPDVYGESEQKMNNILAGLLNGSLTLWITYEIVKMKKQTNGLFITKILKDDITEMKSLLMYCLHTYYSVEDRTWIEGWEAMEKYGRSRDCKRMVVYTDVPYIIEQAKKFDGVASYTFISIPFTGG